MGKKKNSLLEQVIQQEVKTIRPSENQATSQDKGLFYKIVVTCVALVVVWSLLSYLVN